LVSEEKGPKQRRPAGSDYYSVSKLSGTKLGRLLICLSLINRKEKKEELKYSPNKPGSAGGSG
jgi:hypothetical protein